MMAMATPTAEAAGSDRRDGDDDDGGDDREIEDRGARF